jgi:acetyltransferase-like isoleucine patch superfamily enzyme
MNATVDETSAPKGKPRGSVLRRALKAVVFALAAALVSPLILLSWIESVITRGEGVFLTCTQLLALMPGPPGAKLRGAFYCATLERCSWETYIGFGSVFTHRGATLAAHVSMGAYCVIGHANLGSGVMIGSRVSIPSGKRQHFGEEGGIVAEARYDTVNVGAGCWIGEAACLLADVGAGCIVSAGAVVVKAMPARSVIGGNPAQVLRTLA